MLYWAFYGYLPPMEQTVIVGDIGLGYWITPGHWITQVIGETLVAVFYMMAIIIVINLMVAMMSTVAATIIVSVEYMKP